METSTAFIAAIKAKEAASTGDEDAIMAAAAAAKAKAEEEARADEDARAAAAKADEEARAAAAETEKKSMIEKIRQKFDVWKSRAQKVLSIPKVKAFFEKHDAINQGLNAMPSTVIKQRSTDILEGGVIFKEFERDVVPELGKLGAFSLIDEYIPTHTTAILGT